MNETRYRGYTIDYDPIGLPGHSWAYAHDDYDGAPIEPFGPPGDNRCGRAASVEECKREIDDLEESDPDPWECRVCGDPLADEAKGDPLCPAHAGEPHDARADR